MLPDEETPSRNSDPLSGDDYPMSEDLERERRKHVIPIHGRHMVLRIAAFVVLLGGGIVLIVLSAFGYFRHVEGMEIVSVNEDSKYRAGTGITFKYYVNGNGRDTDVKINQIANVYSRVMKDAYRLTEDTLTFDDMTSIGYLNAHMGEEIGVDPRLYATLQEVQGKKAEYGFSPFQGPLRNLWGNILRYRDASLKKAYDPEYNAAHAEYIASYLALLQDESNFTLTFLENNKVKFNVSAAVAKWIDDYDYAGPILTLGHLRNAYRVEMTRKAVLEAGYTEGVITSDDGFVLSLGGLKGLAYGLYGFKPLENAEVIGSYGVDYDECACYVANAPLTAGDPTAYKITLKDDRLVLRNMTLDPATGYGATYLSSALLHGSNGRLVETVASAYRIARSGNAAELNTVIASLSRKPIYTIHQEDGTVHLPKSLASRVRLITEGYTLTEYGE